MEKGNLQKKIEERAAKKARNEYKKFVEFMQNNELCQLLKFKKGDKLVPFCDHYSNEPLFETGIENDMLETDKYTNFNEAREELLKIYIDREERELLNKIDSLSDYFN